MSKKVLVDTNIFLDYYLNRQSGIIPIGEFAFQFVQRTLECEFFIVICVEAFNELLLVLGMNENELWGKVLKPLRVKNKIEVIKPTVEQKVIARRLAAEKKVSFVDAVSYVMAKENSLILVTRDKHFFEELNASEIAFKPEEL